MVLHGPGKRRKAGHSQSPSGNTGHRSSGAERQARVEAREASLGAQVLSDAPRFLSEGLQGQRDYSPAFVQGVSIGFPKLLLLLVPAGVHGL